MLFQKTFDELLGAWEEPYVVGTRIEIDPKRVQVLWQSGVVLDTAYTAKRDMDGKITLHLKHTGMRYKGAVSDYADAAALYWANDTLHFHEVFPITGESAIQLKKTDNTRYGNYDAADDILPLLQGVWDDGSGYHTLHIRGRELTENGQATQICVLKSRSAYASDGYVLADADPSRHGVLYYCDMRFTGDAITAQIPVCDAPSQTLIFHKQ